MHGTLTHPIYVFRTGLRYAALLSCTLVMLLALQVHAQEQPEDPEAEPATTVQEEAPATPAVVAPSPTPSADSQPIIKQPEMIMPPASNGNGSAPEQVTHIRMNFENAPLNAVFEHLSKTAGFIVIKEAEIQGTISIIAQQPVTIDEAVMLLNTMLKQRGLTALRNDRVLTIISLTDAKKRYIPVKSGNDPDQILRTDEVITQVIPLRYTDATKLKTDLAPLLPEYAVMSANAASNSLILTDTSANVKRIVQIVRELDQHVQGTTSVRVFPLMYADAANVARIVKDVFATDSTSSNQNNAASRMRQMFFRGRGGPGGQQPEESGASAISNKVLASADTQTNTVAVSGPADTLTVVADVIKQLDSNPTQQQEVFIYHLKNGTANTLASRLTNLFKDSTTSSSNNRNNNRNNNQAASSESSATDLKGEVTVIADADSNSLMVMTSAKNYERVQKIIDDLDRAVPQVLIKVLVAEVTHDGSIDLGMEFSGLNIRGSGNGFSVGSDFGVAAANTDTTAENSGFKFSLVETNLTAALHALETVGKLNVLSRPYILTSDNKKATITVGEEVPFIRDTRTTDTGQTINTIEYEDIGIILNVTPHINPDGLVIMDVSPEISNIGTTKVAISSTVNAVTIAKRSASCRVAIQNGQTIVIGGLVQDRNTSTVRKIPLLGDIPLLGELFKRTEDSKSKTELLIFLTPHVADQPEILKAISEAETKGQEIVKDAMQDNLYEKHLERMGTKGNIQPEHVTETVAPKAKNKQKK
jgi:general secretion pathway protein D